MKKGCNSCKFYDMGNIGTNKNTRYCLKGNKKEFELWWKENGHKTKKEELTNMDCFEETKISELLNDMNNILDKMNNILDRRKNKL
ncbi:hypothetical protein K9M42_03165 [Patescibacteria group bacterium]|nr:hypothetical protein [Patescibacteria group bacterium]